jgi:hypothetical protein
MPKMKNRYMQERATFVGTPYGNLSIELAVGQTTVLVKDAQGIKLTLPIPELRESQHVLVQAVRELDANRFNELCDKLEAINA